MTIKNSVGRTDRKSLLRFDVSKLASNKVTAAKLRLHANVIDLKTRSSGKLQALAVDGFEWKESSMTWNDLPDLSRATQSQITTVTASIPKGDIQVNRWVELDVTDLINQLNGKPTLDLVLVNPVSNDRVSYFSFATQNANRGVNAAQLVLTNAPEGFRNSATVTPYR